MHSTSGLTLHITPYGLSCMHVCIRMHMYVCTPLLCSDSTLPSHWSAPTRPVTSFFSVRRASSLLHTLRTWSYTSHAYIHPSDDIHIRTNIRARIHEWDDMLRVTFVTPTQQSVQQMIQQTG